VGGGEHAVLRAVEIHNVQPRRAVSNVSREQVERVVVVARLRVESRLEQANAAPLRRFDCGNQSISST